LQTVSASAPIPTSTDLFVRQCRQAVTNAGQGSRQARKMVLSYVDCRHPIIAVGAIRILGRSNSACRSLMSVPRIGALSALAYVSTVEDPGRFNRSRSVGAHLGLTPRLYQSGEVDRSGRISISPTPRIVSDRRLSWLVRCQARSSFSIILICNLSSISCAAHPALIFGCGQWRIDLLPFRPQAGASIAQPDEAAHVVGEIADSAAARHLSNRFSGLDEATRCAARTLPKFHSTDMAA
jgi:Transposase IS116/IS110/IS902 family